MPHIVVNNAVIQYPWKSILDQPPEDFESQFASCTMHNVHMAQAFLPAMMERGWGRFIGINTECAMLCNPNSGAYASAKRGMDGIYRTLAKEIGYSGVTVNQVAPGWMISDRDRASGTEHPPEVEAALPLRHRGMDADIANAVLFLASDMAAYITGAYLPVCGGNVMPAI
jgi:3-oxoacyl-[acyl-carrier protein] reductase